MRLLVEAIHDGALGEVRHLIHIGIGGSALGPALALDALARDLSLVDVHVVSNIDGLALEAAFAACDPQTTLIAVASKTFTTIETMTNAASALSRSEEHTSELQSLMRISYAVFCLKKKNKTKKEINKTNL